MAVLSSTAKYLFYSLFQQRNLTALSFLNIKTYVLMHFVMHLRKSRKKQKPGNAVFISISGLF